MANASSLGEYIRKKMAALARKLASCAVNEVQFVGYALKLGKFLCTQIGLILWLQGRVENQFIGIMII